MSKPQAAYALGDYPGAERAARDALAARARWPVQNDQERRDQAEASIGLALALARQGRGAQALEVIDPVVKLHRELAARNHGDQWQHVELASALYVQALCDPARRVGAAARGGGPGGFGAGSHARTAQRAPLA